MNLKWLAPIVTLSAALTPAGYGQTSSACHSGRLLDVREDVESVPAVQVGRVHREGKKDWTTFELPSTRKQTTYSIKVALDRIIYTPRSSGDFRAYNPSRVIAGDELEACVEANGFVITRPDGRRYKPTITRKERDQEPLP
jgi:hypothetical protein